MKEEDAIKAKAIMDFVGEMVGAYSSNFINKPVLTLGQLYQVARNHCKDSYGIDTKPLHDEVGMVLAGDCNPKIESLISTIHRCPDWDFMQISKADPEFEACLCEKHKVN